MLDIQQTYQELLAKFIVLHKETSDLLWLVFPSSEHATTDDLVELRKLVAKIKEAHSVAESFFQVRKFMASRNA